MYINSNAMPIPGKSIPTIGVKIDGKYDDAIFYTLKFNIVLIYLIICKFIVLFRLS